MDLRVDCNSEADLRGEIEKLRDRIRQLEDLEETITAIQNGDAEALIISSSQGPRIFTLAESESESSKFRGDILTQISDAVIALNSQSRITYFNAAAEILYGVKSSEILGRRAEEVLGAQWLFPKCEGGEPASLEETGNWRGETSYRTAEGKLIVLEAVVTRIHGPDAEGMGLLATLRDITERKEAQQALRRESVRKDEFLAMLGHELRNPLSALRHAVETSMEVSDDSSTRLWAQGVIDRQSQQLTRIVDDLLDVARINSGRINVALEPLNLVDVIHRAVSATAAINGKTRHDITVAAEPVPVWVAGDAVRLDQVFGNILGNACKYTPAGGHIGIELRRWENEATVRIRDNGIGIEPSVLPNIFELFSQAEATLDRSLGGLGVGLSVVKSIVNLHGGEVSAQSAGPGKGSCFTVSLPLCAQPSEKQFSDNGALRSSAEKSGGEPVKPGNNDSSDAGDDDPEGLRILIVDDHHDASATLAVLLRRRHYNVAVANDASSALIKAKTFRPSVFLLDLGLPDIDGFMLAQRLRGDKDFASALLVAISGYAQSSDLERSKKAGFNLHLAKPARLPVIVEAIEEFRKNSSQ